MSGGRVELPVPAEAAFDYLSDPRHRAEWQFSLRRVEDVHGEPRVGQTWVDVTVPGLRPRMRTTVFDRPQHWAEAGTWRGVSAHLDLRLEPQGPQRCVAHVEFRLGGPGPLAAAGALLSVLAKPAVLADVRRAGRKLAERSS